MAGPFFEPAAYVADQAVSPAEWSRQRTGIQQGIGGMARDAAKMRQQQSQFDTEQQRLRGNEAERQREWEAGFGLDQQRFGLATAAQALDEEKLAFEREQEAARQQALAQKREDEGVQILMKAMEEAETVDEYNTIADMAARQYGLELLPGGGAGTAVNGDAGVVPPSDVVPVFDEQADAQRNKAEQRAVESLPPGGGKSPQGQAVSRQITEGATQAAEGRGLPTTLGVMDEIPDIGEASKKLMATKSLAALDEEDRQRNDSALKQSALARSERLKSMGLTPEQLAYANYIVAQAHGIPAPEPQFAAPPQPGQDPNAPPMAMEVTLPENVVALASAPPDMPRSVVTEGRDAGGFTVRSRASGRVLGTIDWNAVQEAKRQKRAKQWEPLINMAQNPRDRQMFKAAADAYIVNGDKGAQELLQSYMGMMYREEAAYSTQDRLIGGEARLSYDEAYGAAKAQQEDIQKRYHINDRINERLTMERSISAIERGDNPVEQGAALADALASAATRRATDKDFERFVRMGLYDQIVQYKNYLIGGGQVSPEVMTNIKSMLNEMSAYDQSVKERVATELYENIMSDGKVQKYAPDDAESLASQRVQEMFPGENMMRIVHPQDPMLSHRREARERRSGARVKGADADERVKTLKPSDLGL